MVNQVSEELLEILKNKLIHFMNELISLMPSESDLYLIRFFLENHISSVDIMDYIVKKLLPLQEHVHKRDENFFLNNQLLFEELRDDSNKVNYFKNIWESSLDEDDKNAIWQWFDVFIDISNRYQKSRGVVDS